MVDLLILDMELCIRGLDWGVVLLEQIFQKKPIVDRYLKEAIELYKEKRGETPKVDARVRSEIELNDFK